MGLFRECAAPRAPPNEHEQARDVSPGLAKALPHPAAAPSAERVQSDPGRPRAERTGEHDACEAEMTFVRCEAADDGRCLLGDDPGRTERDVRPRLGEMTEEGVRFHGLESTGGRVAGDG